MDSSYYYDRYRENRDKVRSYEGNLKELRRALDNLTGSMDDEIRNVNKELDDLKSDLGKSVRHNSRFSSCANEITREKEKGVTADPDLSIVIRELEEEISRVDNLRNTAANNQENYYQQYKTKKDEERQAFWDSFF